MEIKISNLPSNSTIKLIELKGVLDLLASKEVTKQLIPLIEEGSCFLIADLSKLEYINSTGISCLVECFTKVKQKGGYFKFVSLSEKIKEILGLVGLIKVIPMFDTLEEALIAPI